MTIAFFSNYLNHHQLPFCMAMSELTDDRFFFVATEQISEWRMKSGYRDMDSEYPFVIKAYEKENDYPEIVANKALAERIAIESDIVVFGQCPMRYIRCRMEHNKISFRYSERVLKTGMWKAFSPNMIRYMRKNHVVYNDKPLYLLCASAYASHDFNLFGAYKDKAFRWGYFPEVVEQDLDHIFELKRLDNRVSILWAGRLIEWKHPEIAVRLAEELKRDNFQFVLRIVGGGDQIQKIQHMVEKKGLADCVDVMGVRTPKEVRSLMEEADVFLFTSSFHEGWGAVLNEAMNSACAVVASHAIGSVPYLIQDNANGIIYRYSDFRDLYQKTVGLINDPELRELMGKKAYMSLYEIWNARTAAERLIQLSEALTDGLDTPFADGPCSRAMPLKNNWY